MSPKATPLKQFAAAGLLIFLLPVITQAQDASGSAPSPNGTAVAGTNETKKVVVNTDTHKVVEKVTHLRVRVLPEPPFVMRKHPIAGTGFEGVLIDVLEEVARRANLTYTVSIQPDYSYGYEHSPGNWTGTIGSLKKNESDLAVIPLTITSKREEVIDFTYPVMSSGLRILYKIPDPWSSPMESFGLLLSPFSPGLWVLLVLVLLACAATLYVIGRFSPLEDHAFVGKAATYEGLTLLNSLLYVFTSLTFQGYTAAPRSISGRVMAGVWWMFCILVIGSYCASLCAVLLSVKPNVRSVPFASFEELVEQNNVAYGIVEGGSTEYTLKKSTRPLQRRLWAYLLANRQSVMVKSVNEGVMRVQASNGNYAFLMEGPMAEYMSTRPPCTLMTLGEAIGHHSWGFACRADTDVCQNINHIILELVESDFVYDMQQKWYGRNTPCTAGTDGSEWFSRGVAFFDTFGGTPSLYASRTFTLARFSAAFLLLFLGVVASVVILLAEIFYAKRRGTAVPQRLPRTGAEDMQRIDQEYRDEDA